MPTRQVIALAGVGNLGKYLCEELLKDSRYSLVILSRQTSAWFKKRQIDVHITDYSEDSVLHVLNATNATVLISFINCTGKAFIEIHCALLNACIASQSCKRFIPSEFAGNIDDFPEFPGIYGVTREPFRKVLLEAKGVEWTLFENGWLMDYFLPEGKTYMPAIPDEFPVDPNGWKACIRGTGDEPQSWTSCRDIAKALVALLSVPKWEAVTYVAGQWGTFNEMVRLMETFYDKPLPKSYRTIDEIHHSLEKFKGGEDEQALILAQVEEWTAMGASACPLQKTLRQRDQYFSSIQFLGLKQLLEQAQSKTFV
ncbi:NAD(P)-binding protein [Aspergillus novoparasiticus]|uniref:NAD(P)-binding protein n=1 Tax=Aspergillus novoparasiticus TaxID=986946 RepID=A0A5N6EQN1_9EURO|nr:NAD(P)-binding protein [Aspergillus novoparasiticus]